MTTLATLAASAAAAPGAAQAHGPAPSASSAPTATAAKAAESRLRGFETQVLGTKHAAEHARQRTFVSSPAGRASLRRLRRQLRFEAARRPLARKSGLAEDGGWTPPFSLPVFGIHTTLLPTGKVMFFSYPAPRNLDPNDPDANSARAWLWDPAKGTDDRAFNAVNPPLHTDPATGRVRPANIWCAGQSLLADGQLLVTGGNLAYEDPQGLGPYKGSFRGLNKVYTFDPFNERWTEQPDMRHGRWYPTQTLLPDGRTWIMSGDDETGSGANNMDLELFTPAPDRGGRGTVTLEGTRGAGGPPDGGIYPHVFGMPSGKSLVAGPYPEDSWYLNPPGSTPLWQDVANGTTARYAGTSVMLPTAPGQPGVSGRVMQLGGGGDYGETTGRPNASTEVFDEANPAAGWTPAAPLQTPRSHHNTVLLPDGGMVSVGGGYGRKGAKDQWATDADEGGTRHRTIEIFDPVTKTWRDGPPQLEPRAYHSTALLLPDGRVLSAGDDINPNERGDTAEIYEPAYLHKGGRRPVIETAPSAIAWGQGFRVGTSDPIARAVLMAPGAVTHSNNMSQRHVELEVLGRSSGRVDLRAPAGATTAAPGYYMLFLLDARGVPSVARWVRLGATAPAVAGDVEPDPGAGGVAGPGTPPGPGPGPGPGTGPGTPPGTDPDRPITQRKGPKVSVRMTTPRRGTRVLRFRAEVNRAASVRIAAVAEPTRAGARPRPLFTPRTLRFARAGGRSLSVRLSSTAARLLASRATRAVAVTATARDRAGRSARTTVTVRPAR